MVGEEMSWTFRIGSIVALVTTVCKLVAPHVGISVITFISQNASFLYGIAVGIIIAGFTRRIEVILLFIAAVFFILKYLGV